MERQIEPILSEGMLPGQLRLELPRSKSIWARLLLISALWDRAELGRLLKPSAHDVVDIRVLKEALTAYLGGEEELSLGDNGTAMRLLMAFLALHTERSVLLRGSLRLEQRPLGALIKALRRVGCQIECLREEGFLPLRIAPIRLKSEPLHLEISAQESSQYLSALLIACSRCPLGTELRLLSKEIVSRPYVAMTLRMLHDAGICWQEEHDGWQLRAASYRSIAPLYEPLTDGSAMAYIYEWLAFTLPLGGRCTLEGFYQEADEPYLQGDSRYLMEIYRQLGLKSSYELEGALLVFSREEAPKAPLKLSLKEAPDLVPSVVATCLGLEVPFEIREIAHLSIKESDRISATIDLSKRLGYEVHYNGSVLSYNGMCSMLEHTDPQWGRVMLPSYNDHRMAMAFAPLLALRGGGIISGAEAVAKSFPHFWQEMDKLGLKSRV